MFACSPPSGTAISCKYYFLKKNGYTGTPITAELPTSDRVGRFRHYRNAEGVWSIHWHPETGAHEAHGAVRDKWASLGWERFGYPTVDTLSTGRGSRQRFKAVHLPGKPEAAIIWTPQTGAHAVSGEILFHYESVGAWHSGPLGYPISDEKDRPGGGRTQSFEHGVISWTPQTGAFVEQSTSPPSKPNINVSKRNGKIVVNGSYFNPGASVRIRVVVGYPGNEFSDYANADRNGSFSEHEIDVSPLPHGITIWVSATDGRLVPPSQDITGFLWSKTVPLYL
ncbi:LGFP repeat-containing protein [Bacillus pseudomycoides]|uniref:LGFP repeat-containing protein n=1 Tax=Bacillus pseudomycoides TaxID=64104 RepID=UPI00159BC56C|nr:hypothetical protein [Bacillus pseudomycoides]